MDAYQYIYTSWKNGTSTEKGYMIYSKSEEITDAECTAIKDAMQYLAPKELPIAPTPEEIADVFPYSFAYFILPTGRGCVAQSTYLGRDYSGRFGNYIIYALVFDTDSLPCLPSWFFGEEYIKTFMTEEELNASSPVPPLPALHIETYGSIVNDDQITEFLADREDELAQMISMVLAARDNGVPFYLNDTRENLVLWSAAIQRALPFRIALQFTFNTYMCDPEILRSARVKDEGLDFRLIGVRPDANYFNYANECRSTRQVVMDFIGGYMTEGIEVSSFAAAMASSILYDSDEIDAFNDFIARTSFNELGGSLDAAYRYYRLLNHEEYEHSDENLEALLSFGMKYCSDSDNSEIGSKLVMLLRENGSSVSPSVMKSLWEFVSKYTDFMMYSLFDMLNETLVRSAKEASAPCSELETFLDGLQSALPEKYRDYLDYFKSQQSTDNMILALDGCGNLYANSFFITWMIKNFKMQTVLSPDQPVSRLFSVLTKNASRVEGGEKMIVLLLVSASSSQTAFDGIYGLFASTGADTAKIDKLCSAYIGISADLSAAQKERFEGTLSSSNVALPFASSLFAAKIGASKKPEEEFWNFYKDNKVRLMSDPAFSIDSMAFTCLRSLDSNRRQDMALEMVRKIDPSLFRDRITIRMIIDSVCECSCKTLAKEETTTLQRICTLKDKLGDEKTGTVEAIVIGQKLDGSSRDRRPVDLAGAFAGKNVSLASFDKADYETYVKNYFDAFFGLIGSVEDIKLVMNFFYNEKAFSEFVSEYVSAIKKPEKKDPGAWLKLVSWTCVYVINAEDGDPSADEFYKSFMHYMHSLDDGKADAVKAEVSKSVPAQRCEMFFKETRRKEGFFEKIFRGKK